MSKERWPNFFIVGAPRAGTTSLYEYLKRVPGIYMSPVKEPGYFAPNGPAGRFGVLPIRDKAKYLRLFQGAKGEIALGEASASYLSDPEAPKLIHEAVPGARIIMILRDPVEQVYSNYLLHVREGWQSLPFQEAVQLDLYLQSALYTEPVKRYLDVFGVEQIKIFIFEEFIRDPRETVREVVRFLGVQSEPPVFATEVYNGFALPRGPLARRIMGSKYVRIAARSLVAPPFRRWAREKVLLKKARKPPMPEAARTFLAEFYRDEVRKLEEIIGRALPWPLASPG
jgi:hypothetical protein